VLLNESWLTLTGCWFVNLSCPQEAPKPLKFVTRLVIATIFPALTFTTRLSGVPLASLPAKRVATRALLADAATEAAGMALRSAAVPVTNSRLSEAGLLRGACRTLRSEYSACAIAQSARSVRAAEPSQPARLRGWDVEASWKPQPPQSCLQRSAA